MTHTGNAVSGTPRPLGRVHVVGAGPVGLFLTALLQFVDGQVVRLYERRAEYTRTRMVALAEYLVADSIESYKADEIDGQDVEAIFEPLELETRLAYRRSVVGDLRALLDEWTRGFVPLNTIERSLSDLIEGRAIGTVERISAEIAADEAVSMLEPGDILVDCTGARSLMRDLLLPGDDLTARDRNTKRFRLEYALVITFLYSRHYATALGSASTTEISPCRWTGSSAASRPSRTGRTSMSFAFPSRNRTRSGRDPWSAIRRGRTWSLRLEDGSFRQEGGQSFHRLNRSIQELVEGVPVLLREHEGRAIGEAVLRGDRGMLEHKCARAQPGDLRRAIEQLPPLPL